MFLRVQRIPLPQCRTFKNFGHKRIPEAPVSVLWHGFLTFSFIGCCLEHKRLGKLLWGDNEPVEVKVE